MTGEQVYSLWCDGVSGAWRQPRGIFESSKPHQPPREPVAYQFLTRVEREGWSTLARLWDQTGGVDV